MRFITITLIVHAPDPVTGAQESTADRFRSVTDSALLSPAGGNGGFVPASPSPVAATG